VPIDPIAKKVKSFFIFSSNFFYKVKDSGLTMKTFVGAVLSFLVLLLLNMQIIALFIPESKFHHSLLS